MTRSTPGQGDAERLGPRDARALDDAERSSTASRLEGGVVAMEQVACDAAILATAELSVIGDAEIGAAAAVVARRLGFAPTSIAREVIERVIRRFGPVGDDVEELLASAASGETYFFRHPEHFEALARRFAGRVRVRAWSAGCATGEEAYSLAACLGAVCADVDVLATDVIAARLAAAAAARYSAWSSRPAGPHLWPLADEPSSQPLLTVRSDVRARVRFAVHNVLDAPPSSEGPFDVIFCRNVLVYFDAGAAARAIANLASALAPGGLLFLGPLDVADAPPGLVRVAGDCYARSIDDARAPIASPIVRTPAPVVSSSSASNGAIKLDTAVTSHMGALELIERGQLRSAEVVLEELRLRAPDYLPALLECALLYARRGRASAAERLMRELSSRTARLADDDVIVGPEDLPASYYAASARAFLHGDRA